MDDMGMTNEQYKGLLLDELEDWEEILEIAIEDGNERIRKKPKNKLTKSMKS